MAEILRVFFAISKGFFRKVFWEATNLSAWGVSIMLRKASARVGWAITVPRHQAREKGCAKCCEKTRQSRVGEFQVSYWSACSSSARCCSCPPTPRLAEVIETEADIPDPPGRVASSEADTIGDIMPTSGRTSIAASDIIVGTVGDITDGIAEAMTG